MTTSGGDVRSGVREPRPRMSDAAPNARVYSWPFGRLAQLEERLLYTQEVAGSSPAPPTPGNPFRKRDSPPKRSLPGQRPHPHRHRLCPFVPNRQPSTGHSSAPRCPGCAPSSWRTPPRRRSCQESFASGLRRRLRGSVAAGATVLVVSCSFGQGQLPARGDDRSRRYLGRGRWAGRSFASPGENRRGKDDLLVGRKSRWAPPRPFLWGGAHPDPMYAVLGPNARRLPDMLPDARVLVAVAEACEERGERHTDREHVDETRQDSHLLPRPVGE